ncbi:hypothetical protein P5G50_11955 [Leifsonia sp. F6_8S_P_1B]|uniref:Uncharacterized protein n=1 Tax=Leifsonia williamsii TaxID=3035919 RepID=A0ABT8KCJ5_9MICO|nr:hypothetical protein [Leifsonia williamsii]MDN4615161.1 hypothetical protein [Leifsonia williamsii]
MSTTSGRRAVWVRPLGAVACGLLAVIVVGSLWRCPPRRVESGGVAYDSSSYVVSPFSRPSAQCTSALPWPDDWWAPWVLLVAVSLVAWALFVVVGMLAHSEPEQPEPEQRGPGERGPEERDR